MNRTEIVLQNIENLWFKCRPLAEQIRGINDWEKDFIVPMTGINHHARNQAKRDVANIQLQLVKMLYTDNLIDTLDALAGRLFER